MEHQVTFHIDTGKLPHFTDSYIASLWHIAQANPAPFEDAKACELAEAIGREIIRRWLAWAGAPLWDRQGVHQYAGVREHVRWDGEKWVPKAGPAAADVDAGTTPDVSLGMEWWNNLGEQDRMHWMREAGDTGRVVDAWEAFKEQTASAHKEAK